MWTEALNLVGVLAALVWRKIENVYYPPDIREAPTTLPPPAAPAPTLSEQPSTTQVSLPPPEVSIRLGKACDQGQGVDVAKGKGVGQGGS